MFVNKTLYCVWIIPASRAIQLKQQGRSAKGYVSFAEAGIFH